MLNSARSLRDSFFYARRSRAIQRDWRARFQKIFSLHPEYQQHCPRELEQKHVTLWSPFARPSLDTLRVCWNIAGNADPRIVPEELFAADLERCLNPADWPQLLSHKSFYRQFFPTVLFPHTYLHNIAGAFYDHSLAPLDADAALAALETFEYPVVLKPNTGSSGGQGVSFPASAGDLRQAIKGRVNFIVQRFVEQHSFFQRFNTHGLNTLRVDTYKSVTTNTVHVLDVALRMGRGGSLDNETAGGIVCHIGPNGELNDFAVDKYGKKFDRHPDTGIKFGRDLAIPRFQEMIDLARQLGASVPFVRLAGWDICLQADGRWVCIELNLDGLTTRFAQYAGRPFFGEFTSEVIQYCVGHPNFKRASLRIR